MTNDDNAGKIAKSISGTEIANSDILGLSEPDLKELEQARDALQFLDQIRMDLGQIRAAAVEHPSQSQIATPNNFETLNETVETGFVSESIGRFRILEAIGQGGFARVFRAYDPTLDRDIALKIPKPQALMSEESRSRFEREARAAAVLSHPAIVPVFEAGEFGPIAYIASAFVPGKTLAAWFAEQSESLDVRSAAGIMAVLADAVEHAHQRGVIHRDLKPANILIEEGDGDIARRIRITDFGLAKQINSTDDSLTIEGAVVGTPAYMSPEQASSASDVGPGTDVYALGVILYELLTGKLPFRKSSHLATLQAITNDPVPQPRKTAPEIPRDLEAICLKCLNKSPSDRYATAFALSEDLGAWLESRPVSARPISSLKIFYRWCQRNPVLAVAVSFAFLSLAIGLSLTTWKWLESNKNLAFANSETIRANREAETARVAAVNARAEAERATKFGNRTAGALEMFTASFQAINPVLTPDPNMTAREVLSLARKQFETTDLDDEGQLILLETLIDSCLGIGDYSVALELALMREAIASDFYGETDNETRYARYRLSNCYGLNGDYENGIRIIRQAIDEQTLLDPQHQQLEDFECDLGSMLISTGQSRGAIAMCESALSRRQMRLGVDHPDNVDFLQRLAQAYASFDDPERAIELFENSIDLFHSVNDDAEHPTILVAKSGIASAYSSLKRRKEAAELRDTILASFRRRLGETHPTTLLAKLDVASALVAAGEAPGAIDLSRKVLETAIENLGQQHPTSIRAMTVLSNALSQNGQNDEAISTIKNAIVIQQKQYPDNQSVYFQMISNLAVILQSAGMTKESIEKLREAREYQAANLDPLNPQLLATETKLADSLFMFEEKDEAIEILESVRDRLLERYGEANPSMLAVLSSLANNYTFTNRTNEAIEMFEMLVTAHEQEYGINNPQTIAVVVNLGSGYRFARRYETAIETLENAIDRCEQGALPADHFLLLSAKSMLGATLRDSGETDQGWAMMEEVYWNNRENRRFGWVRTELLPWYLKQKNADKYDEATRDDWRDVREEVEPNEKRYGDYLIRTGNNLSSLEKYDQAIEMMRLGVEILDGFDDPPWAIHHARSSLGGALLGAGELDEALPLLTDSYAGLLECRDAIPKENRNSFLLLTARRLLELARARNDAEAEERWKTEMERWLPDGGQQELP